MKQEVTLTKQEVNQAILDYAEKHGVRLDDMTASVEVMATRGDRELFATIALEPNNVVNIEKPTATVVRESYTSPEVRSIQDDIDEDVPVEVTQEIDDEDEIFG